MADFLEGAWRLTRRMRDIRRGEMGRLAGEAHFTREGPGLFFYEERGTLSLGGMRTEAQRAYRYEMTGTGFRVLFPDGRFFHEARRAGKRAEVAHDCAPDLYRGRYRFQTPDLWFLSWRITGPRKDLVISSLFLRLG